MFMTKFLISLCGANTALSLITHSWWLACAWGVATLAYWRVLELEDKYER